MSVGDRLPAIPEQRDPRAATQSLRYVTAGRAQPPDWDARRAFEYGVYSNVVVFACFEAIANTIASLPVRVGPDPNQPQNYNASHPLARLLDNTTSGGPNPNDSAFDLWTYAIVQYLATGRWGWEIESPAGSQSVAALWPLVSAALKPIPSTSGNRYYSGFEYGRPGQEKKLTPDRIVYGWKRHGLDVRQPESALEAAHLDVSIAVAQSRYDYAFLQNDSRPAALVITEEFENEDSYQAFKQQWEGAYGGPRNAGKAAFLETTGAEGQGVKGAVDVKLLGMSSKDAQAAQRYSDRLGHIAIALGVPWSRLDASNRTFDNATEEDRIWWGQRLLPLCRRLASTVNIQLAPRFGNDVMWFDTEGVIALKTKRDPITEKVGAPSLYQAGIMTVNEARADYGLPPVTDGDELIPIPVLPEAPPVTVVSEPAAPAALPAGGTDGGEGTGEADAGGPGVPGGVAGRGAASVGPALESTSGSGEGTVGHEARRLTVWARTDATVRNLERVWERAMKRLFNRQATATLARLEGKRGRQAASKALADRDFRQHAAELFDPVHWRQVTAEEVHGLYEAVAASAIDRLAEKFGGRAKPHEQRQEDVGFAFDVSAPWAQDFIDARANQLAGQVTDTTYAAIQEALNAGIAEGEGIPDLSNRVRGVFDTASKSRATTISRTETISAYNGSASLTGAQLGSDIVAGQEWIAARDARTRESHALADGQERLIGEAFIVGGHSMAYPGDPSGPSEEVVNCRCTIAMLTPEDMGRMPRMVERRTAELVLSMVGPETDEATVRTALAVA